MRPTWSAASASAGDARLDRRTCYGTRLTGTIRKDDQAGQKLRTGYPDGTFEQDNQDRKKRQDNFFKRADRNFEGGNLGEAGQKPGQADRTIGHSKRDKQDGQVGHKGDDESSDNEDWTHARIRSAGHVNKSLNLSPFGRRLAPR